MTFTETLEETSMGLFMRLNEAERQDVRRIADGKPAASLPDRAMQTISNAEGFLSATFTKKARRTLLERFGPTLLVFTFIEDALRIPMRWEEQTTYLSDHMGFGHFLAVVLLLMSFITQLSGAGLILAQRSTKVACYMLLCVTALQPFVYGQHSSLEFMTRSLTMTGGFFFLIQSENEKAGKKVDLLSMKNVREASEEDENGSRLQLVGRLALTSLFLFQTVFGQHGGLHGALSSPGVLNVLSVLVLSSLSLMVCVGFKTEWSSIVLTIVLFLSGVWMYPFWSASPHMVDHYRYYFFQTLSVMGGMLLLTVHGPGGLSLDGQKKKL